MSYHTFTIEEVADYLHLTTGDVERLLENEEIPSEERGDRVVFRKQDIDAWASQRILGLKDRPLAEYHQKTSRGTRQVFENAAIIPQMMQPDYIAAALAAKTRASVLREMVALAEKTGKLVDPKDLLASLEAREELCSTGLPGGLALLHPRHHDPYMFESSFIVLGRPVQEIHFGAPDGQPTHLFFLVCCQDDRIHLHTLARICLMAEKTELLEQLRLAPDAATMFDCIVAAEQQVLTDKKTKPAGS
jgi:nitrogen PTS system EIIA component